MSTTEFEENIKNFYKLLLQEKACLVAGQPEKLLKIVDQKREYIKPFQTFNDQLTPVIKNLIKKVQQQQQENLLLTKQSIGFEEMLLKTIRNNLKESNLIYSKDPHKKGNDDISLIDWQA